MDGQDIVVTADIDVEATLEFSIQRFFAAADRNPSAFDSGELERIEQAKLALEQGTKPGDVLVNYSLAGLSDKVMGNSEGDHEAESLETLDM